MWKYLRDQVKNSRQEMSLLIFYTIRIPRDEIRERFHSLKTSQTTWGRMKGLVFGSHLIFLPLSATLVLLRIPAFSSRCPCRDTDMGGWVFSFLYTCRSALKCDSSVNMGAVSEQVSVPEGFSINLIHLLSIRLISRGNVVKHLKTQKLYQLRSALNILNTT